MKQTAWTRPFRRWSNLGLRWSDDRGATAAEYALIAALIAVVIVAAVTFLGLSTRGLFNDTAESFSSFNA